MDVMKKSAAAETNTIERLNTRNNTMSGNLIYTYDGDYGLRTNRSVSIQRNRTQGEALTFTITTFILESHSFDRFYFITCYCTVTLSLSLNSKYLSSSKRGISNGLIKGGGQ